MLNILMNMGSNFLFTEPSDIFQKLGLTLNTNMYMYPALKTTMITKIITPEVI